MTTLIAHPVLAAGLAAFLANCFVAGVAYGLSGAADRHGRQFVAWCRTTFTAAGDDRPPVPAAALRRQAVRRAVDEDGQPRRLRGLVEIHRGAVESFEIAKRRRQLLGAQ